MPELGDEKQEGPIPMYNVVWSFLLTSGFAIFLLALFPSPWSLLWFLLIPINVSAANKKYKQEEENIATLSQLEVDASQWREQRKHFRTSYPSEKEWAEFFELGDKTLGGFKKLRSEVYATETIRATASQYISELADEIEKIELSKISAAASAIAPKSATIEDLARLREAGLISEDEFKAFARRFEKSSGEVAKEIISAIENLHVQHTNGAMTEGNYHSSLWTLMDKLDREMIKKT